MTDGIDPRQVLDSARDNARNGRHAEALEDFIWFHDNALKHAPNLRGVRSSFALLYWHDLARGYPPAGAALHEDTSTKRG